MNQLLEKNQILSLVPQNFKNSNKGKIIDIQEKFFTMEILHAPEGLMPKKMLEFYSQTKNGMLYFSSFISEVEGNTFKVSMPRRHRFLQRRAFTRIVYFGDIDLRFNNDSYKVKSLDLSAGGMKFKTANSLSIDNCYDIIINLLDKDIVKCQYKAIKIEKNEDEGYTVSGRFQNLTNTDRMKLIQFCIRKSIEKLNH